jgi:hypothetical protein
MDATTIAASSAVASAIVAIIGVIRAGNAQTAKIEAAMRALEERVRQRSGDVKKAVLEVAILGSRVRTNEDRICHMLEVQTETRDMVRDLAARLGG